MVETAHNSLDCARLPYRNVTEFDGPEEMQIQSDEGDQKRSSDGDGSPSSADDPGAESMTDDDVALDGDGDDQPDRVVTDGVQSGRRQLARPLRQRLHVQPPRLQYTDRSFTAFLRSIYIIYRPTK